MTTRDTFEYALLRVVPDIERGELVNVGVLLHCRHREHLAVRTHLDRVRVRALDPAADLEARPACSRRASASAG